MVNERSFTMPANEPLETQNTKERIRQAAVRVFSCEGFDRSSVKSIAQEAGVAVGSIYNHFRDKDDLLISIFEEEFKQRMDFLEELRSARLPVRDQVQRLLEDHFARAREHKELAELLLYERFHRGGRLRERIVPLQRGIVGRIAEILRAGIAEGWIRPCNPKVVAQALFDLVQTMTACWVLSDPSEADEIFASAPKELADLMWKGLRQGEEEENDK
jgi:TetR/AcrR family fatty acid metabolism transcriptional regulator